MNCCAIIILLGLSAFQGMGQPEELELSQSTSRGVFVKFEGIDGESKDADHNRWCDLASFNFGGVTPGGGATGQSRRRAAVVLSDFVLFKELDKASPVLFDKFSKGEIIPRVEIEVTATYGGQRQPYLYFELENVLITSYFLDVQGGENVPMETVTLNYEKLLYRYTEYDQNGSSKGNVEAEYRRDKEA